MRARCKGVRHGTRKMTAGNCSGRVSRRHVSNRCIFMVGRRRKAFSSGKGLVTDAKAYGRRGNALLCGVGSRCRCGTRGGGVHSAFCEGCPASST